MENHLLLIGSWEGFVEFRNILFPIDFSARCAAVAPHVKAMARPFDSPVFHLHVVENPGSGPSEVPRTVMELELEKYLKDCARVSVARLQQETGTAFDLCLQAGEPSRVVETVARHHEADLAIIGRGKLQAYGGRLRTHDYSIICDSPCPVMSI